MAHVLVRIALMLFAVLVLTGCSTASKVLSIQGACDAFEAPPYAVKGRARYDQRWIDGNVEAGVGACQWQRPAARPASLDAAPAAAVSRAVGASATRPSLGVRARAKVRKVFHRSPPAPVAAPAAQPMMTAPLPPAPPRSDLDELLDASPRAR